MYALYQLRKIYNNMTYLISSESTAKCAASVAQCAFRAYENGSGKFMYQSDEFAELM